MDPRNNPFTPCAGAQPPALVGRHAQIEAFDVLLDRLQDGYTEKSLLVNGLRGVGKTVLLTDSSGWRRRRAGRPSSTRSMLGGPSPTG